MITSSIYENIINMIFILGNLTTLFGSLQEERRIRGMKRREEEKEGEGKRRSREEIEMSRGWEAEEEG